MIVKFIHKPVNHFYNKRCWVSVPFKQREIMKLFQFLIIIYLMKID